MRGRNWSNGLFVRTALPTFGFVIFGWLGLSQLMESKIRIKRQTRGTDTHVEEYDPTERMRRLATGAERRAMDKPGPAPKLSSLEEELAQLKSKVNIHDFDYVPVPRTDDEEE